MSQEATVNKPISRERNRSKLRTMVQIAMLSAVSTVLMMFEFPIPFVAPPFIKMDFSELPALVGTFAMGPVAGMTIELLKNLLHMVTYGSSTGGVGELSNFLLGCAFVVPAGLFYKHRKTRKNAVIGMAVGTIFMVVMGCFSNAFVIFPVYSKVMGVPMEAFIQMGTAIQPAIHNMMTFVMFCLVPFNLIKGIVISFITLLLYKRLRVLLKGE